MSDAPGVPSLDDAAARLDRYCAQRCGRWTAYQIRRLWLRFLACPTTGLDRPLLDRVQAWLGTLPASEQRLARVMVKAAFGATACDWSALVFKHYRRNEQRLSAGVLRDDARGRVRAAANGPRERALIECLWVLRRAETAAVCWQDLDLPRGMITVLKGKGNKPSWTLLPSSTREALAAWFEASGCPPDAAPVFPVPPGVGHPTRIGGHYTPGGIGRIVQKILTRAGCWSPGAGCAHRFRRSFATTYLRANPQDLTGLMRLMRHEQIATTQKYVWLEPEDLAPRLAAMRL